MPGSDAGFIPVRVSSDMLSSATISLPPPSRVLRYHQARSLGAANLDPALAILTVSLDDFPLFQPAAPKPRPTAWEWVKNGEL